MNTAQLLPRLQASFTNCAPLGPEYDMIRCERIYNEHPRSVYFFKGTELLPDDVEMKRILAEVVSPSYFRASGASRWSHYVVFVASDTNKQNQAFRDRQRDIEEDKSYARKFVVYASELDAFVDHSFRAQNSAAPSTSVANVWTQKLQAAGLGQIQTRDARASIVRAIRFDQMPSIPTPPPPVAAAESVPAPAHFLKLLQIDRFADRQIQGTFRFGRVNLIRGANGSGKTSLLEAIEHYFCGATYRSRGQEVGFEGLAIFTNSKSPVPYKPLSNSQYQAKDQRWYGRTINRGNRLWEGFSRFNFLNTDAAVEFSRDGDLRNLTESLSKIALGPDAAYTWSRIGEFDSDLAREIGPIDSTLHNLTRVLETSNARRASLAVASPQLEALLQTFLEALKPLSWSASSVPKEGPVAAWFLQFNPLQGWLAATEHVLAQSIESVIHSLDQANRDIARLVELDKQGASAARKGAEVREARSALAQRRTALRRCEQYLQAGFPALIESEAKLLSTRTNLSRRVIPEKDWFEWLQVTADVNASQSSFGEFELRLRDLLETARHELQAAEGHRLAVEQKLRATDAVLADVRQLGRQYAEIESQAQACPLCRTEMDMAELLSRIESLTDQPGHSSELETVGKRAAELKQQVQRLASGTAISMRIKELVPAVATLSIPEVIDGLRQDQRNRETANTQLTQLQAQFTELRKSGFNAEEFATVVAGVRTQPNILDNQKPVDSETLSQLQIQLETDEGVLKLQDEDLREQGARDAAERLQIEERTGAGLTEPLPIRIQGRIRTLQYWLSEFGKLPEPTQRQFSGDLWSLVTLARDAAVALDQLNVQAQAERARTSETKALTEQITRDEEQLKKITQERQRLQTALSVLHDLKTHHSLESGLTQFLSVNLDAIQSIFSKIHVPNELRLSNLENCRLQRIGSKDEVDLTQISTGQRAALMLSIFLSLNLSLRSGPPMMLIDDPIAHIDDLNALSFVDYLGDLAESGRRQIFFATANEKLGNVFQKKMEFLGTDFVVLHMKREQSH